MVELTEEQQNPYTPPTTTLHANSPSGGEKAVSVWIIYAIALYLACYAVLCFGGWIALGYHKTALVIEGLVIGADAIGFALKLAWSRWLFYGLSIAFLGLEGWNWSHLIMRYGWPFHSWVAFAAVLIPLVLTLFVFSVGAICLPRFFRQQRQKAAGR